MSLYNKAHQDNDRLLKYSRGVLIALETNHKSLLSVWDNRDVTRELKTEVSRLRNMHSDDDVETAVKQLNAAVDGIVSVYGLLSMTCGTYASLASLFASNESTIEGVVSTVPSLASAITTISGNTIRINKAEEENKKKEISTADSKGNTKGKKKKKSNRKAKAGKSKSESQTIKDHVSAVSQASVNKPSSDVPSEVEATVTPAFSLSQSDVDDCPPEPNPFESLFSGNSFQTTKSDEKSDKRDEKGSKSIPRILNFLEKDEQEQVNQPMTPSRSKAAEDLPGVVIVGGNSANKSGRRGVRGGSKTKSSSNKNSSHKPSFGSPI